MYFDTIDLQFSYYRNRFNIQFGSTIENVQWRLTSDLSAHTEQTFWKIMTEEKQTFV